MQHVESRLDGGTLVVRIPMRLGKQRGRKRILAPDGSELTPPDQAAARRRAGQGAGPGVAVASDRAKLKKVAQRHKQNTDRLHRIWRDRSKAEFEYAQDFFISRASPTRSLPRCGELPSHLRMQVTFTFSPSG